VLGDRARQAKLGLRRVGDARRQPEQRLEAARRGHLEAEADAFVHLGDLLEGDAKAIIGAPG
jgi:hypothetical protein